MAGFILRYRCCNFTDKNPVIDRMRTVLQREGYFSKKRRRILHQLSGVALATYDGWFEGGTRSPRSETIYATMNSIGYKEEFVKAKTIDEEKELAKAQEWFAQMRAEREKTNRKGNGRNGQIKRAASSKKSAVKRSK